MSSAGKFKKDSFERFKLNKNKKIIVLGEKDTFESASVLKTA